MLTLLTYLAAATSNAALAKPSIPTLPRLTVADCNNETTRNRKLAELSDDNSWTNSADTFNNAWEDYTEGRMDQLGMSRTEKDALVSGVVNSDAFQSLQTQNEAILGNMSADMESIGDVDSEAGACKIVVKMLGSLDPIMANATKQWELIDQAIVAEAKRRGIKLD